ncbi:hypothetical protein, partial [Burkholderia sp. SIMBA_051]|uniref:hypothetical protein n=1 Tax=Burkholderia sp. SIMBA_051 TaxID=3085792 RepID=UPI00397D1664
SIVKPDSPKSEPMILFFNALQEYAINPLLPPILDSPDFKSEGDHYILNITQPDGRKEIHLVNHGKSVAKASWGPASPPSLWLL